MNFEFMTAGKIKFGQGTSTRLPEILPSFGSTGMVYAGMHLKHNQQLSELLNLCRADLQIEWISGEPIASQVDIAAENCRNRNVDFIVAIGGGSVLDFGKAVSMLATNEGQALDYLEVIGHGKKILYASLPLVAIPTTAGTGSEVTKNAVIRVPEQSTKASLRHDGMIPRVAIVDPVWMTSIPQAITASTGFDAITQVIEPYLSIKSNWMIDSLCLEAIQIGMKALRECYYQPNDLVAREKMAYVSLIGGISLANAGLGAVHAFAAAIGGMYDIPHGKICACLLPSVVQQNTIALQERDPQNPTINKIQKLDEIFTVNKQTIEGSFLRSLQQHKHELQIPSFIEFGINDSQYPAIIQKALNSSSMRGNPIQLDESEMDQILRSS